MDRQMTKGEWVGMERKKKEKGKRYVCVGRDGVCVSG